MVRAGVVSQIDEEQKKAEKKGNQGHGKDEKR